MPCPTKLVTASVLSRATSREFPGLSAAPRAGPSRLSVLVFSLAFGAAVAYLDAGTARALDAQAPEALAQAPVAPWCIQRILGNEPPACVYESFISCAMAAVAHGSWCRSRSSLSAQDAAKQNSPAAVQAPQSRARTSLHHRKAAAHRPKITASQQDSKISASPHHKITAAEREELFREFMRWKRRSAR
jgi:hypothetical protein